MSSMFARCMPVRFLVGASLVALLVPFLAGCGESKIKVSGTVMYGGKPLPGGTVTFQATKGKANPVSANFGEDGKFEVDLPTGDMLVGVDNQGVKAGSGPIGLNASDKMKGYAGQPGRGPTGGGEVGPKGQKPGGAPQNPGQMPDDMKEMMKGQGKDVPTVGSQKQAGTYVPINAKYYSPDTSGLKQTIDSSTKSITITLE